MQIDRYIAYDIGSWEYIYSSVFCFYLQNNIYDLYYSYNKTTKISQSNFHYNNQNEITIEIIATFYTGVCVCGNQQR